MLRGEVLAAKGSMYDEAKSELEELQRKHDGLLTEVASLRRMK